MKAVLKTQPGPGNIAYTDFSDPIPQAGQVVVEVRAAGICGTDLSLYSWSESMVREFTPTLPVILGHEFSGVVVDASAGVRRFKVGDRVTANPVMYCGTCRYCQTGRPQVCDQRPLMGVGLHGCFAQFVAIREENVFPLPPAVSFETGAMNEVLCAALHALDRVAVGPGDTVAVIGAGPMGFLILLAARAAGASQLVMTGLAVDRDRLQIAASLGAQTVVVDESDPADVVRDLTRGLGADVVFECAGHPTGLPQALRLVRKGGRIGILGMGSGESSFNTATLAYREIEIVGTRAYDPMVWHRSYDVLASGQVPLEKIVTHRLSLEKAARGMELMKNREGLKVLLIASWG
jgi:2-desacetyl-2-hydroxyethyl bacteriochlorophyllide A dehydrogenase